MVMNMQMIDRQKLVLRNTKRWTTNLTRYLHCFCFQLFVSIKAQGYAYAKIEYVSNVCFFFKK